MGYQIIKEREAGKFALFSSVTDTFVMREATQAEVVGFFVEQYVVKIIDSVAEVARKLDAGQKPYHQFTMTLEEAEEMDREHSKDEDDGV